MEEQITLSIFRIVLSGVPQESILCLILFNIFINDFFLCLSKAELYNFSDGNKIFVVTKYIKELIKTLEKEDQKLI